MLLSGDFADVFQERTLARSCLSGEEDRLVGVGNQAERILELNVEHPVFTALETAVTEDPEKAKKYATLLYNQALLIAGLPLEDPAGYTDLVCELMK